MSEEEEQEYHYDDNVYHNEDSDDGADVSVTDVDDVGGDGAGEEIGERSDMDNIEDIEEDESTPHVASDVSKTQSPCSTNKSRNMSFTEQEDSPQDQHKEKSHHVNNEFSDADRGNSKNTELDEDNSTTVDIKSCVDCDIPSNNVTNKLADRDQKVDKADNGIISDNEASSHYRSGDEPEPIDLTHLNVEASMMSLASKIRVLCGKANSPTLSNRTFRFRELDSSKKHGLDSIAEKISIDWMNENERKDDQKTKEVFGSLAEEKEETLIVVNNDTLEENFRAETNPDSSFKIPDVPKPASVEQIEDWAGEVRPSMRKLRQGMDSLLKTSRLVCSVLRLKQVEEAVTLTHEIKYRRDVCFSQALTSLVSSLMSRLWCRNPDIQFIHMLTELGPLVYFEGLLSLHGEDVTILNDMIVAVEDLRSVEFTLVLVEKRSIKQSKQQSASRKVGHMSTNSSINHCNSVNCSDIKGGCQSTCTHVNIPFHSVSSYPLPRVTGSRNNMKVLLPVPDWVYTQFPILKVKNMRFTITPVLFNVGVNEMATIAEKLGNTGPQNKNNSDNFRILTDYIRRYKKFRTLNEIDSKFYKRRGSRLTENHHLEDLVSILRNEVNSHKAKNIDIFNLVAQITYILGGIRMTSCKSGKDRTGMAVTLEQVNLLSREFDLADTEYQRALDTFRSEGVRRINCKKNIGVDKFAFNSLQLRTFPTGYIPPQGTYGAVRT